MVQRRDRQQMLRELNAPAPIGAAAGITRFLYDLYLSRPDLQRAFPDLDGDDGPRLAEWAHRHGRDEVPIHDDLLPKVPEAVRLALAEDRNHAQLTLGAPDPHWGVNVVGFLTAELGLGEGARQVVGALDAGGVPLLPIEGRHRPDCRHEHPFTTLGQAAAAFPVNLVYANPEALWELYREAGRPYFADRYSIGIWWWEVEDAVPTDWLSIGPRLLDEIWVGSRHVARCLEPFVGLPVRRFTMPVTMAPIVPRPRGELGLPEGFLFLFVFDYNSAFERKNPLAVLDAFTAAFAPGDGAALAIKCINSHVDELNHARLTAAAAAHPQVRLLDGYASPGEKDALLAACDCFVSLHRAEGFGHALAEAMYLGKPVIATGYSGNREFMTEANSYLVDHTMTKVGPGVRVYPEHATWAEPDIAHASRLMREVFEDPAAAAARGRRGAADVRATHSPQVAGERMERELGRALEAVMQRRAGSADTMAQLSEQVRAAELAVARGHAELLAALRRSPREDALAPAPVAPPTAPVRSAKPVVPASSNGSASNGSARSAAARRLERQVASVPYWRHAIDLGEGIVTPGEKGGGAEYMERELEALRLPDLDGKSVLDVGAWDGFYSFEAERRGARRVVALDHYAWEIDRTADDERRPHELPGKRGFDLAHQALASRVEPLVANFMEIDVEQLGTFDVVLFLGVLYHLEDPLAAMHRVAAVTGEVAVIESAAVTFGFDEHRALWEFFAFDQLDGDPTSWWAPNLRAIHDLCAAAGFRRSETVAGPPPMAADASAPRPYRAIVHAWR